MIKKSSGIWALVVAAGKGERLGLPYNKVYYPLAGRSVLSRCFDALGRADCFGGAVLVLSGADMERYRQLIETEGAPDLVRRVVAGGDSRQRSVKCGLDALPTDARIVAIHDAARAFVPGDVVRATIESAIAHGSGVAATRLSDTIKRVDGAETVLDTLDRDALRAVQTPQSFRVDQIRRAHEMAERDGFSATDDAALMERYIGPVRLCCLPSGAQNHKLTTMEDLRSMESRLSGGVRVGHGYDVHRLVEGRRLVLCGVEIPHETGLLGHSDADVATHTLMDALLGAAAMGDIGRHFPDNDAQYKGISSIALLERVASLLFGAGCRAKNIDLTIACERPKLAPHIEQMRLNIARALRMSVNDVNIKATTTEGLGFEGRGEGISAAAVALIEKIQ